MFFKSLPPPPSPPRSGEEKPNSHLRERDQSSWFLFIQTHTPGRHLSPGSRCDCGREGQITADFQAGFNHFTAPAVKTL